MADSQRYPAYGGEGPLTLRVGLALGSVATIFIILRAYVRLRINDLGGWALFWTVLAWAATVTTQAISVFSILHGLGNDVEVVAEKGQLTDFLFYTWLTFFFFNLAVPLGKVAICAFLLEVESRTRPVMRWLLIGIAAFNVIVAIPQLLLCWFQCSPVTSLWDPERQQDCNHQINVNLTYFVGAVAVVTDFALATIPGFILWPLQMDRRLKIGLSLLMATGVFAGVAAIIRTYEAQYVLAENFTYDLWRLFLWGEIEEWLVIICACVPPVWPLFRPLFQKYIVGNLSRIQTSSTRKTQDSVALSSPMYPPDMASSGRKTWNSYGGLESELSIPRDKAGGTWIDLDSDLERPSHREEHIKPYG